MGKKHTALQRVLTRLAEHVFNDKVPADVLDDINAIGLPEDKFSPPSIEEVEAFMRSLGVLEPRVNATKWWHFYNTRGWMVGKTKMRNWKSAVHTWDLPKMNV